jgi:hypothetical protein
VPTRCPHPDHASTGISYSLRPQRDCRRRRTADTGFVSSEVARGAIFVWLSGVSEPGGSDQAVCTAAAGAECGRAPDCGVPVGAGAVDFGDGGASSRSKVFRGVARTATGISESYWIRTSRERRSSRQFLQNAYTWMTTPGRGWGIFTHRSSRWGRLSRLGGDRRLHAPRHRAGMGKSWRSYRRGCERRFAPWPVPRVSLYRHCCHSHQLLQFLYRSEQGDLTPRC